MEEKELLLKEIKGLIADSTKENVNKADLDKTIKDLNAKIEKLSKPEIDSLPEIVNKLIAEQAKLTASVNAMNEASNKKEEKPMTLKESLIAAAVEAGKNVPNLLVEREVNGVKKLSIKEYFNKMGNKNTPEMVVKVGVDMLQSTIVQSNVNTVGLTRLDPQTVGTPLAVYQHVVDWMPVKPIDGKFMSILVVYDYQDGSGTKTQGSTALKSSFLLKTVEFVSATIGTKFRVSDESLADLPQVMDEIARVAPSKIKDNIDYQILGSAGDDTTTLKGLYAASKHTDFASATTYAAKVPNAGKIDVLSMMKDQAETSKYIVDHIIINPLDVRLLAAEKDQLDNSKIDRRVTFDALGEPLAICGMLIKRNTNQTANTVAVVAKDQLQIGDRMEMRLEIGYDGNDFTEGYKTIIVNVRLAFAVRDPLAVIYCDALDTAVSLITT